MRNRCLQLSANSSSASYGIVAQRGRVQLSAILFVWVVAEPAPLPERTVSALQTVTIGLTSSAASLPTLLDGSLPVNVTPFVSKWRYPLRRSGIQAHWMRSGAYASPEIERSAARWFNPVALDGLTFIVHPDNTIADLSLIELQAIFSGKIDNWAQVGGPQIPIEVVSREIGSGRVRCWHSA